MKCDILFRGKRVIEPIKIERYAPDGWVYGGLLQFDDEEAYILPYDISGEMYINKPYRFRANDFDCSVMLAKVDPQSIGQYTGLTDKNGKKIFDGDIISAIALDTGNEQRAVVCFGNFIDENNGDEYIGFFIEFDGIKTTITQLAMEECKNRIEVIGNAHDNPELLQEYEK